MWRRCKSDRANQWTNRIYKVVPAIESERETESIANGTRNTQSTRLKNNNNHKNKHTSFQIQPEWRHKLQYYMLCCAVLVYIISIPYTQYHWINDIGTDEWRIECFMRRLAWMCWWYMNLLSSLADGIVANIYICCFFFRVSHQPQHIAHRIPYTNTWNDHTTQGATPQLTTPDQINVACSPLI